MTLGTRVAVMQEGALVQVAPPMQLYTAPANRFVGEFMGSPAMNLIECTLTAGRHRPLACGPLHNPSAPSSQYPPDGAVARRASAGHRRRPHPTAAEPAARSRSWSRSEARRCCTWPSRARASTHPRAGPRRSSRPHGGARGPPAFVPIGCTCSTAQPAPACSDDDETSRSAQSRPRCSASWWQPRPRRASPRRDPRVRLTIATSALGREGTLVRRAGGPLRRPSSGDPDRGQVRAGRGRHAAPALRPVAERVRHRTRRAAARRGVDRRSSRPPAGSCRSTASASDAAAFFPAADRRQPLERRLFALPWFVDVGMLYWRTDLVAARARPTSRRSLRGGRSSPDRLRLRVAGRALRGAGHRLPRAPRRLRRPHPRRRRPRRRGQRSRRCARWQYMRDAIHRDGAVPGDVLIWQEEHARFAFQNGRARVHAQLALRRAAPRTTRRSPRWPAASRWRRCRRLPAGVAPRRSAARSSPSTRTAASRIRRGR